MNNGKAILDRDILVMLKSALTEYMGTKNTNVNNIEDILRLTIQFEFTKNHLNLEIALLNLDYELTDHFYEVSRHVYPFAWSYE